MKKRILCILLICCMVFSLFPVSSLAANSDMPFTDIKTTDWFYDEVCYAYEHELMQGTSATTFDPDGTTSRGMIVTILYRLEGEPSFMNANIFTDVVPGSWYEKAVVWANGKGIVEGYGNEKFGPDDPITREQLATIMYRYANYKGYDTAAKVDLSDFVDSGKISSYALDAMKWANAAGLINGIGASKLDPQGDAARAQAAAILMRFCEKFVTEKTYTVTFDLNYGSDSTYTTQDVKNGEMAVRPAAPTRSGYTFAGWYKNAVGGSKFDFGTAITADLTLYAHWTKNGGDTPYTPPTPPAPTTYTVTFDVQGHGSAPASQTVAKNGKVTEPTAPTADGWTFGGWYKDAGCSDGWNFATDKVTANTTLYAKWTNESPNLTIGEEQKLADGVYKLSGGTYNNLTIPGTVGNGDVTLDGVTITGKLIVEGGGSNSVHLDSCAVETIEVNKEISDGAQTPRIDLVDTSIENIVAKQPVIIEADKDSAVEQVEAQSDVTVQGATTEVKKVTVPESAASTGVELKIEGAKVAEVAAEKPVTIEATAGASPIEKVEAKDNVTVKGNAAQIEQVQVPDTATKQPVIDVQTGTVAKVKADKPAEVKGDGKVTNVEANAEVKVASETVTTITVTVQVTVTVTGNQPVEVAVATEQAVNITTQGTATVAVSTTVETDVNVTLNNTQVEHIHKWNETNRTPATCSAEGSVTYTCVGGGTCDKGNTKTETLPMLPHTEQIVFAKAATCTETGLTSGKVCAVCEAILVEQKETAAIGHTYATVWSSDGEGHWHECIHCADRADSAAHTPGAAATETTDQTCTVCGYVITPSTGHQCASHLTRTAANAATCTAAGNSEYYTCTCGKFYSDANAANQIEKDSWSIPATGHDYGTATYEWKAVSGGYTCTATRICSHNKNHKETETVTASYTVTTQVDCETNGVGIYTATFANSEFGTKTKEVTIPATGHSFASEWSKDATYHWHAATCGHTDEVSERAEHMWNDGVETDNEMVYICTVCGQTKTGSSYVTRVWLCEQLCSVLEINTSEYSTYNLPFTDCGDNLTDTQLNAIRAVVANGIMNGTGETTFIPFGTMTRAMIATILWRAVGEIEVEGSDSYTDVADSMWYYTSATTMLNYGVLPNEDTFAPDETAAKKDVVNWLTTLQGKLSCQHTHCSEWVKTETTHSHTCNDCHLIITENHKWNEGVITTTATGTQDGVKTYTCTVCEAKKTEVIPANYASVSTVEALTTAMNNDDLLGAELTADLEVPGGTLPAGKTLIVPEGKTLTVTGKLYVYGMLDNKGTISNQVLIDVFGGASLTNSGTIAGVNPDQAGIYASSLGIEGGATLTNTGTINDCISVADYYGYQSQNKLCTVNGSFEIDSGNFEKMAVVFDVTQIQTLLNNNSYEIVMPCGTDAANENSIELVGITVPAEKILLLKGSVFDGTNTYRNSFTVNSGTLTMAEDGYVVCKDSVVTVAAGAKIHAKDRNQFAMLNADGHIYADADGYTLTSDFETVTTYEQLAVALGNNTVAGVYVNADITVPAQNQWTVLDITKPVVVANGKTLTVAGYTTDGDKSGFLANDLTVVEGGSLTLGENAVLKTTAIQSGENEPFYRYVGRVCVSGGTLDVSAGTVVGGSFFNYAYSEDSTNSNNLNLGSNTPEIEFSVHNDAQLRAAIADSKCTGGVIVEDDITLESGLTVTKLVLVNNGKTLTVPAGKTLTVTEDGMLQVSGTLNVCGTLANNGEIFNLNTINVFGGSLENTGTIRGAGDGTTFSVENGGMLDNVIGDTIGTIEGVRISVIDYYPASGDPAISRWELFGDERDYTAPKLDYFDLGAIAFGTDAIQTALDVCVGGQEGWYRYQYVIACGTDAEPAENTVELGGITIHEGGKLWLCNWSDGTNVYLNNYKISEGNKLTLESNARFECYTWGMGEHILTIDGRIVNNGGFYDFGDFTVNGKNVPQIVHSEEELTAALEKGGDIYLQFSHLYFTENEDGILAVLNNPITISKNTNLINAFGDTLYIPGLTVNAGATLNVNSLKYVLTGSSFINGTLNIGGNCFVMLRTPDEATGGEPTELTVANGGKIVIGGENVSDRNAQLGNADGNNGGKLINNGTIDNYGGLRIESYDEAHYAGIGAINNLCSVSVTNEEELVAALGKPYVTEIHVTRSMPILGTADSSDPNFDGCFYLNNEGHNGDLNIYIYGEATLKVGDATHTAKLDISGGVKVWLIQIEAGYAKVVAGEGSCINVFGELNVRGDWLHDDYYTGNINFFPDVMTFGERLNERVGAYELPAMTEQELADNRNRANEWPDDGEARIDGFKLLVKHGNLAPHTEKDSQGNDYIVWRPYDKISYGVAVDVLKNVYMAIDTEATMLPASVALGDEHWTPNQNDLINDHDLEELLNKFVDVLPKVEDNDTTNITLIRDNVNVGENNLTNDGMTINGKVFTKPITITCDSQYLNGDDFGGEIKFENCDFAADVTVKMTDGVNFRVDFGNSCTCTGNAVIALPDGKTSWQDCSGRTNVELFYVSGMSFDTTTNNAFADFNDHGHDKTVSFTLNGLTITDEGEGAFNINARYDENGKDNENQPIFIPTVEVTIFAQANEVKVSGNYYTGKLRIGGNADVSELALSDGSFIEMGNSTWGNIKLGNNTIFVNNDCDGEHSFTGTANSKVIVRDQNRDAQITVNEVNLGTPHIFGEHGEMIFFPLANTTGISFKVEQRRWDEEQHCDVWDELEYAVDQQTDKLHLIGKPDKDWISDPNGVRVTVTVGGCSVVYDTMMWKPVTETEFADKLNEMMDREYDFSVSEQYLTYGKAKAMLAFAWDQYKGTSEGKPGMTQLITDENHWSQLNDWRGQHDEAEQKGDENWLRDLEGWNPDNWTCDWFLANDAIGNLKSTLGIKDAYGDVEVCLIRENDREALRAKISENEEWIGIDGNRIANCRFNGTVTISCGTEWSGDDDFGGCIFFENCDFTSGVTAELKQGINYGIRFNNCTDTVLTLKDNDSKLTPLALVGGNIAVDVRYDDAVPTAEIRSESEKPETITVSGNGFNGKLRISGNADVSGLNFGENVWLELSNNGDSSISLGSNEILVNDDCGGQYSFTGAGRVILPNQNRSANITVNGINLGTPHVFGRDEHDFAIFFPLTSAEGIIFTVEQGQYSEEQGRVPDNAWTTLECDIDESQTGKIHLIGIEGKDWLHDPYQVRVTVTFANGCTVVYDTIMWRPVQMDEFIDELNAQLKTSYTLEGLELPANGDLTIGDCKTAFAAIWADFGKTDSIDMNQIINDNDYWDKLAWWETEYPTALASEDPNRINDIENRNPEKWTRRWNDLDMMLDELTKALGISNDDGQQ